MRGGSQLRSADHCVPTQRIPRHALVMHRGVLRERNGLRFDNFTRATCILYIDLVETLNFQLRYLVEKVARINNKKTLRANSLVTAHSFCVCKCCC